MKKASPPGRKVGQRGAKVGIIAFVELSDDAILAGAALRFLDRGWA